MSWRRPGRIFVAATLVAVSVVVGVVAPGAERASACSCLGEPTFAQSVRGSTAVFEGDFLDVVDLHNASPTRVATSTLTFRVTQAWKGEVHATTAVETNTDSASCGVRISSPGRYVVMATGSSRGGLSVDLCGWGPRRIEHVPEISSLGRGRSPESDHAAACIQPAPPGEQCRHRTLGLEPQDLILPSDTIDVYCAQFGATGCTSWRESADLRGWCWVPTERTGLELIPDRPCAGGATAQRPAVPSGTLTRVAPTVPNATTAVFATITMVDPLAPGYITASRCSAMSTGPQSAASGNHIVGAPVSNSAIVSLDADGRFCVYNLRPLDLVIDVQGVFGPPAPGGSDFVAVPSTRLLDTRSSQSRSTPSGFPPAERLIPTTAPPGAVGALVNVSVVDAAQHGFVADCIATNVTGAIATFTRLRTSSTLAVVPVDQFGRICLRSSEPADLIVDVQGYLVPGAGDRLTTIDPVRVLDSRITPLGVVADSEYAMTTVQTRAPKGTTSAVVNLAMVDGTRPGYVTAGPCATMRLAPQAVATATFATQTVSNLAVVPVDSNGSFCLFLNAPVGLVVDVVGYLSPNGASQFFAGPGHRVLDTRTG